ncbi:hypothetical protein RYX36_007446, partial [Vicia faba]
FNHFLGLFTTYAEIRFDGAVCGAKAEGSGGVLNFIPSFGLKFSLLISLVLLIQ